VEWSEGNGVYIHNVFLNSVPYIDKAVLCVVGVNGCT
jgi:hypothetical protein